MIPHEVTAGISFSCPHCGRHTIVGDQFVGKTGSCRGCGKTITIPRPPIESQTGMGVGSTGSEPSGSGNPNVEAAALAQPLAFSNRDAGSLAERNLRSTMGDLLEQPTMDQLCCPECGKKYALRNGMAGKKVKCKCGACFRISSPAPAQPEPPLPRRSCLHCQQEVLPGWRACPACGQRLPVVDPPLAADHCPHCQQEVMPDWKACPACGQRLPVIGPPLAADQLGSPQPNTTAIRTGDNSIVNELSNTRLGADLPHVIPASPAPPVQPLITTGSESVVKAEIDASYNVSAAGDVVQHKEVHTTHHETHVHQAESGAVAVTKRLHEFLTENCVTVLEKSLRQECEEANRSDGTLFAFIAKQISTIESSGIGDWYWKNPCHYSVGMYALEIIEQRNGGRLEVLDRVARMRDKLTGLKPSRKTQPALGCGTSVLAALLLLLALFIIGSH